MVEEGLTAVVDWNPSGVAILRTYKFGSGNTMEGTDWNLPDLKWLALRAEQVDNLPEDVFQPLTEHDWSVPHCSQPEMKIALPLPAMDTHVCSCIVPCTHYRL